MGIVRRILVALAVLISPLAVQAEEITSAEQLIEVTISDLKTVEETQIAEALLAHVNTPALASFVLGKYKRSISAEDRARFTDAVDAYLHRQIENNADQIAGVDIEIVRSDKRGRDAIVTTRVEAEGEDPFNLRWRVVNREDQWFVVDLEFAGIWLAIEQQAQVKSILDRPGADIDDVIAQFG